MNDNVKRDDIVFDGEGRPVLTPNQSRVLLYLFEHGPDYVYSLADKTGILQQTLDALTKRLSARGLIYVKEEIDVVKKGKPRKIYSLTGEGWCVAVMHLLASQDSLLAGRNIEETLNRGIEHSSDALFGDPSVKSLFLGRWKEILQIAEVYPTPPDFNKCVHQNLPGGGTGVPDLFVSKDDPCWVWYAALYAACSGGYGLLSQPVFEEINKELHSVFFDLSIPFYIMKVEPADRDPAWFQYCCDILQNFDELSEYAAGVFEAEARICERKIATLRAAAASLKNAK